MNEKEQWASIPQEPALSIGRRQFDKTKLTHFFGMMLKIGYLCLALWACIEIVRFQFDFMAFIGSQSFVYILTFGILGWVGNLMLTGKFLPPKQDPNKPKQKWSFDPTGGRGQQQVMQRPQQSQYPPLKPQRAPPQIQYGICSFCGQQFPITELKGIQQQDGSILNVCKRCLK